MLTERVLHDLVLAQGIERLAQVARQRLEAGAVAVHLVEVLFGRHRRVELAFDAVEARGQHDGKSKIGIGAGVGAAQLAARALGAVGVDARDADQGAAVCAPPRNVDGRLVAGHQPLIAVDQRRDDRRDRGGMRQLTGDKVERGLAEAVLVALVVHAGRVLAMLPEALVNVHTAAVYAGDRLGHEGAVQPVLLRDRLQGRAQGDRIVGRGERGAVLEVDLVLAAGDLVVGGLDLDAESIERVNHLPAHAVGRIGADVEVAGLVVRRQRVEAVVRVAAEEEELQLRADQKVETQLLGAVELAAQDETRVAAERIAVGREDIADDARGGQLHLPGDRHEGVQVRHEVHVAFGDAGEAFDRAAVEPDTILNRTVPQLNRDRNLFDDAHDIAELQTHKTHIMAFDRIVDPLERLHQPIIGECIQLHTCVPLSDSFQSSVSSFQLVADGH